MRFLSKFRRCSFHFRISSQRSVNNSWTSMDEVAWQSFYNVDLICKYYAAPFRLTKSVFEEYTINIFRHYSAQYIHRTKCLALSFIYRPRSSRVVTSNIWKVHKHTPRWKWENTKPILLKKKARAKSRKMKQINFGIANLSKKTFILIQIFSTGGGGVIKPFLKFGKNSLKRGGY